MIVVECGSKVVARVEVFDDSVTRTDFLVWNVENGKGFGFENQFFHLRETINARGSADFEGFFGSSPSVCGGEFESADDVRMTEHENIGPWGDLLAGYDFGVSKEIGDKVERMDEKVEQSVTFWIVACEVMEVITDKMFFVQTFPKDFNNRSITFLQTNHCNG